MTGSPSLARRLTLTLTLAVTLAWLAAALAGAWVIWRELAEALDGALMETAQRLLPLALDTLVTLETAPEPGRKGAPSGSAALPG